MRLLITIAFVQTLVYASLYWLNAGFAYGVSDQSRPILPMLAVFAVSFLLYSWSLRAAIRLKPSRKLAWAIVAPAILFRGILLPTTPILEIDIYRYLWDGAVTAQGVNPYRYSPAQVLSSDTDHKLPQDLKKLVQLRDSSPAMADILSRVHYAELPTVYPPVSQAVFALGDLLTPSVASADERVLILKSLLVLFDVGTIGLVWSMVALLRRHPGWVVAYAWCPLVLKEIANTGHLDSIAVFFATAGVWCVAQLWADSPRTRPSTMLATAAFAFALAVGAKLYPMVLLPLLTTVVATRVGLKSAVSYAFGGLLLSGVIIAPMLLTEPATSAASNADVDAVESASIGPRPDTGLKAFLTHWEMNDFLFMVVAENLRSVEPESERPRIWFAVLPNAWREALIAPLMDAFNITSKTAAFLLARAITTGAFVAVSLWLTWKAYRQTTIEYLLEAVFLTLAWFWLLSPTQNPWYWTWALPFLPFARGQAWTAVSGLALIYYFRFWLRYQFGGIPLLGTRYGGPEFFDFVATWVEYLPWFLWLTVAAWRRRRHSSDCQFD